ncbi:leupaxin isoform X3 [Felis catus]|uniref:leupaxin isoform X3 n=1 Tax=Felis catus TaxID=9685 RepID=UPI001D1A1EA0|nr:leupaxin isoform X3 [Felis catus]
MHDGKDALLEELERSTLQDSDESSSPAPLSLDQHSRKETDLAETSGVPSVQNDTSPLLVQLVYTTHIQEPNIYSEVQEPNKAQLPPKTSAAVQLDELMAHLCDMQTQVAAKADASKKHLANKQDQKASLDSMLGGLEQDLQDLGIATVPKGHCASCQKPIAGKAIHALGQAWHPEHFVCAHCKEEIGCSPFFERSGLAYCPKDYHHLFSPRCAYCAAPILDKVLTAMNQTWHPEHFFCSHCGEVFGAEGIALPWLSREGQEAVLPEGFLSHVLTQVWWLQPPSVGKLPFSHGHRLAPGMLCLWGLLQQFFCWILL